MPLSQQQEKDFQELKAIAYHIRNNMQVISSDEDTRHTLESRLLILMSPYKTYNLFRAIVQVSDSLDVFFYLRQLEIFLSEVLSKPDLCFSPLRPNID